MKDTKTRYWPLTALLVSALALAIAHLSERAGLLPCPLCLTQRQAHWAAILIAALGLGLTRTPLAGDTLFRLTCIGLCLCYLAGTGIALYHSGIEWGWFPAPATCSGGGNALSSIAGGSLSETLSRPVRVVSCVEAPFRVLGLSMAGWNGLLSCGLAIMSLRAAIKGDSP